jgi:hypothetical protein
MKILRAEEKRSVKPATTSILACVGMASPLIS